MVLILFLSPEYFVCSFFAAMASLGAASVEYITLKESFGELNRYLARNDSVIPQLSAELFASDLILEDVYNDVQNIHLPAANRVSKLFLSVLSKVENPDNPSKVFSSLITSLWKAGLKDIATILEERLSRLY